MESLRFKRKHYGRGWTPISWQGRVATIIYLVAIITRSKWFQTTAQKNPALKLAYASIGFDDEGNLLVFLVPVIILTGILLIICYRKGETPRWQWGEKKENK